jgi:hypothetical protein
MHCGITDFRNSSPGLELLETHERTTPACLAGRGFHHNFAHILACYTWPSMEDDAHFKHLSLGPSQNQAKSQCQFSHASQIIWSLKTLQIRSTEAISVETNSDHSASNHYAITRRQCGPKEEQEGVDQKRMGQENMKRTDNEWWWKVMNDEWGCWCIRM